MKLSQKIFTISLLTILLLPFLASAANPGIPHKFYGTVTFTSGTTPNGLLVEAKINNVILGTSVTVDGKYGYNPDLLFVTDPQNTNAGKTVEFYIAGIKTTQTAAFVNGESTNLNLIMPSDTVTGNGTDVSLNSANAGEADMPTGATIIVLTNTTVLDFSSSKISQTSTDVTVGGNIVALTQKVILKSGVDAQPIVLINSSLSNVSASIPDGTKIQGSAGWDGKITPPVAGTSSGTAPAGFSVGSTVISIGSSEGTLVFDKPITILLTGVTGTVGYKPSESDTWIQITNTCGGNYTTPTPPTYPGECAINNGTDTKIVTYHFTTFGSLTVNPTPTPAPSGGSGGGGGGISTPADTTAPSISTTNAVVGDTTAVITWQTNEASVSWIVYGKTTTYGEEIKTTSYLTSHSVTLTGLSSATTYHYQLKSKDINENIGSYTDGTFTTLALGEKTKGDINKDNKVDIFDFNTIMVNWGNNPANLAADLDGNDKVDIFDFNLLMVNWTG